MITGEDFFKDKNDDFSTGGRSSPRGISQEEKIPMIEKVFQEVLGREPSSREMAYYRYGILKEDGIRAKLVQSKEHKDLLEKAIKFPGVSEELKSVRISERKLQQKIEDTKQEIIELQKLLNEKNILIEQLREKANNPYDIPSQLEKFTEGYNIDYPKKEVASHKESKPKTFKQKLIDIIEALF